MRRTRGTWNTKGTWLAGGVLAAVLALTGYVVLAGGDEDSGTPSKGGATPSASAPGPSATYAPPNDWTEPEQWAALPRGERTDERGSQVGYPHTTEGAVAAAAALNTVSIEGGRDTVDEQMRIYHSYVSKADRSDAHAEEIELAAIQTDKSLHQEMGVPVGEPLPSGAYMRSNVIGFKVVNASKDEVSVWLLSRAAQKGGEMAKESVDYTRILNAVVWEDGDWKLSGAATQRAMGDAQKEQPKIVAPGDAAFNTAGWTAIREAS
ncbi:Integral membrane protein OS=Streptomyces fumanus OX=67302 GN=GCM10018772_70840 PE=4 SV=1 [Streptomyces fumanus]|uniref:DUF8175 domain-containing protein n=1 Tax=Streptomyces fumanus TaxID=67302 RepID=A0A919B1L4_9ACTN|nr:hypothetical protein [Streptomyces fumanus]GHF35127.1 hypothetical protein GCM10018772_70840 [Streptomyces fumanus]